MALDIKTTTLDEYTIKKFIEVKHGKYFKNCTAKCINIKDQVMLDGCAISQAYKFMFMYK